MATKLATLIGTEIAAAITSSSSSSRPSRLFRSTKPTIISRTRSFPFGCTTLHGAPCPPIQAFSGPNKPNRSTSPTDNPDAEPKIGSSTLQDELNYLSKLAGGSVLGAALIKYGSVLIPDITRPNIIQALLMISAPEVVAALLLLKESRKNRNQPLL